MASALPVNYLVECEFAVVPTPPYSGAWYEIVGDDSQMLEVAIPPGREFVTVPGAMVHHVRLLILRVIHLHFLVDFFLR